MPWCLVLASELRSSDRFTRLDFGGSIAAVGWWKGVGSGAKGSDAGAGEGSRLGEDDDAALAGDVAFH